MNKKIITFIAITILCISGYLGYQHFFKPKKVHYHAGFKVFVDGKQQSFYDAKYMSLIPCGNGSDGESEQLEKAHLHDGEGDVAHVHRDNATWGDLFKNINYKIDTAKPIEGYINGKKTANILSQRIHPYESMVILIGSHKEINRYLSQSVQKGEIQAVEKHSESCGT